MLHKSPNHSKVHDQGCQKRRETYANNSSVLLTMTDEDYVDLKPGPRGGTDPVGCTPDHDG
jgi:hypothetical protein